MRTMIHSSIQTFGMSFQNDWCFWVSLSPTHVPKFLHKEGEKGIYDLRTTAGIPNCMREAFAGQVNRSGLPGSSRRLKFEEDIYGAEPAQHPEMGQNNIAMDDPSSARLSRPPIENIAEGREEDLSKSQDIESPSAPDKLALHRDTENSDEGSGKTKELLCQYCGREMESLIGKASWCEQERLVCATKVWFIPLRNKGMAQVLVVYTCKIQLVWNPSSTLAFRIFEQTALTGWLGCPFSLLWMNECCVYVLDRLCTLLLLDFTLADVVRIHVYVNVT